MEITFQVLDARQPTNSQKYILRIRSCSSEVPHFSDNGLSGRIDPHCEEFWCSPCTILGKREVHTFEFDGDLQILFRQMAGCGSPMPTDGVHNVQTVCALEIGLLSATSRRSPEHPFRTSSNSGPTVPSILVRAPVPSSGSLVHGI